MSNLVHLPPERVLRALERAAQAGALHGGGEPPDNGAMDARVAKLETIAEKTVERLGAIERDLAVIKSDYATKADIHAVKAELYKAISDQTWKLITWTTGLGAAMVAITFFIARNVR